MDRIYSIDYFKFWAMFFIVCIHTAPFYGSEVFGVDGRSVNFLINTFSRFAVPFFFVSAGFLFVQKILSLNNNNNNKYFKKYFAKLFKIFISWYLFYLFYDFLKLALSKKLLEYFSSFPGINIEKILFFLFYGGGGGVASYHLWYLSALIWSILIVYIFIKKGKLNLLLYISLILNIIGLLGQTYSMILDFKIFNYSIQTRDTVFFGLFYTTLGSWIALNYDLIKVKIKPLKSYLFIILFLIFSFIQLLERTIAQFFWDTQIKSVDFYFSTIFLSISLFLFVIKNNQIGQNSFMSKIGSNSVGIYVLHTFFVDVTFIIFSMIEVNVKEYPIFHLIFTPLVFAISYFCYSLLQKIKLKIKSNFINQTISIEKRSIDSK